MSKSLKTISGRKLYESAYRLAVDINLNLRKDILLRLRQEQASLDPSKNVAGQRFLSILLENAGIASKKSVPLCQDTGLVIGFLEVGKGVCISGEAQEQVKKAVEDAYRDYKFRASVVNPLNRDKPTYKGTLRLHVEFTKKNKSYLTLLAKGFGSENKSRARMFLPTASEEEIIDFVVETVALAGPAACPPFIIGVGIGGTLDYAAFLAKKALCLRIKSPEGHKAFACAILRKVNKMKMGVLGLGYGPTALGVNVLTAPTHIAGLPVAVSIGCHSTRSGRVCL